MDPLMVLMMATVRAYRFDIHCDIIMVKCLAMMKASNWDYLAVN